MQNSSIQNSANESSEGSGFDQVDQFDTNHHFERGSNQLSGSLRRNSFTKHDRGMVSVFFLMVFGNIPTMTDGASDDC